MFRNQSGVYLLVSLMYSWQTRSPSREQDTLKAWLWSMVVLLVFLILQRLCRLRVHFIAKIQISWYDEHYRGFHLENTDHITLIKQQNLIDVYPLSPYTFAGKRLVTLKRHICLQCWLPLLLYLLCTCRHGTNSEIPGPYCGWNQETYSQRWHTLNCEWVGSSHQRCLFHHQRNKSSIQRYWLWWLLHPRLISPANYVKDLYSLLKKIILNI